MADPRLPPPAATEWDPSHLGVPSSRSPQSPTRSSTLDDSRALAPELEKQYLHSDEFSFATGGFADVFDGRWESPNDPRYPDGVDVAIKVFRLGGVIADPGFKEKHVKCGKHLGREVFVWQRISHPRITPFIGYIRDYKNGVVPCLVSPKRKANLPIHFRDNPKADRVKLLCQILEGLVYLHTFKPSPIVHLDIKPENILITDEGTPELCDFGYAKMLDGIETGFTTGPDPGASMPYAAPETLQGVGYGKLTPAADMFAVGSLTLYALSGKAPWFELRGKGQLTMAILLGNKVPTRQQHPMEGTPEALDKAWELMKACWSVSPAGRPTSQQYLEGLHEVARLGGVWPASQ